jgi:hypothetical protein
MKIADLAARLQLLLSNPLEVRLASKEFPARYPVCCSALFTAAMGCTEWQGD